MDKVTYFDVEYANSKNKSICQMGIVCEDYETGDPFYPEKDIYINPDDNFDAFCVKIHGINKEMVADKPLFPEVWEGIEKYFTKSVIIGHNVANADLDALVKNLHRYNIDVPEIYYICTYELARMFIPSFAIADYTMSTLCEYFDIDIDSEHNAFDDACACADLFKALIEKYDLNPDAYVKKYKAKETKEYIKYVADPVLRKSISEFYGVIRGFSIDNIINQEEVDYIKKWREENIAYSSHKEIENIINAIDIILEDGIVTTKEIMSLQFAIKNYLDTVSTAPSTLATQILDGIMKGIIEDGEVTETECNNLRQWLYDNITLVGHFPFNKIIDVLENILEDSVITEEELDYISDFIKDLLDPVASLSAQVNSVEGKHVCLSGNFAFGTGKASVEGYIKSHGGFIDASVKKSTDILMVGKNECQAYSNGTYGTKVKKAMEYNKKGCVGMAANMIGGHKQIIAFNDNGEYKIMLNPKIVKSSGEYETKEGCLSLLGDPRPTKRFQKIKVEYQTTDLKVRLKTFEGFTAQIIQHEIDHCNGILI